MNERKTIFLAIGVLLVAMIASNFTNSTLSGYQIKSGGTVIDINPNPVSRNGVIEVTVYPGPDGVKNEWMWIERNGERIQGTNKKICADEATKSAVCYSPSTVKYLVGTNDDTWPSYATYTVKVEENVEERSLGGIRQKVYATANFNII
ncbi:MAG: hypothetical protein AABX29_07890 [Nanoarchaeota archaeon]